jgi:hypothetical protein
MIPLKSEALPAAALLTAGAAARQASSAEGAGSVEEICSVCQCPIENGEPRTTCSQCGLPFHEECWQANLGCSAYGCANVNVLKKGPDIHIANVPVAARAVGPPPLPLLSLDAPATPPGAGDIPWEYLWLAASAVAALLAAFTFGVPSFLLGMLNTAYLVKTWPRPGSRIGVLGIVISGLGFVLGVCVSWRLYGW